MLSISSFCLLFVSLKCSQNPSEWTDALLTCIWATQKRAKMGLETYETWFPDVRYEANKRQSHVWYTFTCWFTVIYTAKYSWIPHGCKYLQPRMQTFATEVANVCVRKFIHSSAWGNAFCWPSFQMEMGTWESSLERDVGYKTAPKRLFRRIWSEIKRLSQRYFLHKKDWMCKISSPLGAENQQNQTII